MALIPSLYTLYGQGGDNFSEAQIGVSMRMIGHQILLAVGDSSSRVLPVTRLSEHAFRIQFEREIPISPDSLVSIVKRRLEMFDYATSYVVSVKDCAQPADIYSFEISQRGNRELIPCKGRVLPQNCYFIDITMNAGKKGGGVNSSALLLAGLIVVAGGYFYLNKRTTVSESEVLTFGNSLLTLQTQTLRVGSKSYSLTNKEFKLMSILAANCNKPVKRQQLQKQIWEDEGVIVGRSLDMFISRLRKYLKNDASLKIENLRGEGYQLMELS